MDSSRAQADRSSVGQTSSVAVTANLNSALNSAEAGKSQIKESQATKSGNNTRFYTRDLILRIRDSPRVRDSPISLEAEIFRELQVNGSNSSAPQHISNKPASAVNQPPGPNELPPSWKEEGWRGPRFKAHDAAATGSPPLMGPIRSRLVDDGTLAASPDKEKAPGPRPQGPGWRRSAPDWRTNNGEADHGQEGWRPSGPRAANSREEGDRDTWRPPPPGLGRGQPRGPPGLSSSNDQWERPWGAGRGRLGNGERRLTGKPRDPPGVLPPRELTRDPNVRPQLPEGWNKPRDPDANNWRAGKAKESVEMPSKKDVAAEKQERQPAEGARRHSGPAWLREEGSDATDSLSLADTQRKEFEAERKAIQEEREKSSKPNAARANSDVIADDEIEAMRQEALAEENAANEFEATKQAPDTRPDSGFNVDSLFADTGAVPNGGIGQQRPDSRQSEADAGSRFGRWFQLEASPGGADKPATAPSMPLEASEQQPASVPGRPASQPGETFNLQNLLSSGSLPADAQQSRDLAQLQLGRQGAQILEGGPQQPGNPQMQANKPRSITDIERLILDKQLISPRGVQDLQVPNAAAQQQFNAGGLSANNSLLSLLHGQTLREGPRVSEPSFANMAPSAAIQQQHQNLLNGLRLNNPQVTSQLNSNLMEQLQMARAVQNDQQQQKQLQLQLQQQQQQQQGSRNIDLSSNPLLAAFSAQMPRDVGPPKPLADNLFSLGPRDQLNRLSQPQHLGLGQGERAQHLNLGGQGNALQALLQNQQLSQFRSSAPQPNTFGGAPYNYSQVGGVRLGSQGMGAAPNFQNAQASYGGQGMGSDAHALARYIEQQRQLQAAQQQQRLLQQQRLYQLQLAQQQQQQQQQQAQQQQAQQRAAQAALLQQQQHQQQQSSLNFPGLASRLTPAEAALRQQQMLQFQALNLGGGGGGGGADADALARFLAGNKLGGNLQ